MQYRLMWQRIGRAPRRKTFTSMAAVERFLLVLGPEPWRGFQGWEDDSQPDDFMCCNGEWCGCAGQTYRQRAEARRRELDLHRIEWIRLGARPIHRYAAVEITPSLQALIDDAVATEQPGDTTRAD